MHCLLFTYTYLDNGKLVISYFCQRCITEIKKGMKHDADNCDR